MITDSWNRYLDSFPPDKCDVYYTEEYHLMNAMADDIPVAFVYSEGDNILVFPFLMRDWVTKEGTHIKDFETAYGYGGPIANTDDSDFRIRALNCFKHEAIEEGFLSGFVRFHPLLCNEVNFDSIGKLILDRKTIAIDLSGTVDEIWMNEIHTKNRNVIKKAIKEGLTFTADYEYKELERFKTLYNSTMDKLDADGFYYFSDDYYAKLKKLFPDSFIGCVRYEGEIIAAAIFFYSKTYGHYHLAGSDVSKLKLAPNNFLLWEAVKELKRHGVKKFHLGGGINSDESNSLFQFKQKFSKSTNDFYLGKLIFDQPRYDDICKDWEKRNPEKIKVYGNRLLKYRY